MIENATVTFDMLNNTSTDDSRPFVFTDTSLPFKQTTAHGVNYIAREPTLSTKQKSWFFP